MIRTATRYATRFAAILILEHWIINAWLNRAETRYWERKGAPRE